MPSFTTSGTSRPRPRPRPSRRLWNYRRLGTYKVPRGRSSPGRRYLGTVRPRLNPAKQCAIMARKARYRYFGVRSRRYCYGASLRSPLTRFGKTFGVGGMVVYKIGRGELWKLWISGFNGRTDKRLRMSRTSKAIAYLATFYHIYHTWRHF